jgi:hypothetical protein
MGCVSNALGHKISSYQIKAQVVSTAGVTVPVNKSKTLNFQDSCFNMTVDKLPFGGSYLTTLRAQKFDSPLNGVSTFDLVLISKNILGLESFTSAYQIIAADVNKSNSVTTFDIIEIRKVILGVYDTFPAVPAWRLIQPLPTPNVVSSYTAAKDTYQLHLPALSDDWDWTGRAFVAIKYGDVNTTASFTPDAGDSQGAVLPPLPLRLDRRYLRAGEAARVAVYSDENIESVGWQMSLRFDAEKMGIVGVENLSKEQFYSPVEGELRLLDVQPYGQKIKAGTPLFYLNIKALNDIDLYETLHIGKAISAEIYQHEKAATRSLQIAAPAIFGGF